MKYTLKKLLPLVIAGVLGFSLFGLGACATIQQPEEPAEEEAVEAEEELRTIGRESDTAVRIEVTNATNKDIVACSVKVSQDEEYPASLVTRSNMIEEDETIAILFEPEEAAQPEPASGADSDNPIANDVILNTLYNVSLTFDDDTTAELHNLNLTNLVALEVCLTSDGLGYVEFTDAEGETGSTLESEKALKQAEEEAAAQAAAQAEAEAAAQAEAEAAAAAAAQYDGGYSYDTGAGAGSGGQAEDECVPGGPVFNF